MNSGTSRRALIVEDGPTITHGGMPYGAGYVAAVAAGAEIVDPRASADPALQAVFEAYPHIGRVLPAVGYDAAQLEALRTTMGTATRTGSSTGRSCARTRVSGRSRSASRSWRSPRASRWRSSRCPARSRCSPT